MDGMSDGKYLYLEPGVSQVPDIKQNTSVVRLVLDIFDILELNGIN